MRTLSVGIFFLFFLFPCPQNLNGQNINPSRLTGQDGADNLNTITTAVPFLLIAPDARAGGMGNTGVSHSYDWNSDHWNPSKTVFSKGKGGFGASYVPWLQKLVNDIHYVHAGGYYKFNEEQAIGASAKYFSLGEVQFRGRGGNRMRTFTPKEYMFSVNYSRKLGDRFSAGFATKYIYSDLLGNVRISGQDRSPGESIAADLSFLYRNDELELGKGGSFNFGLNISNIGPKIRYTNNAEGDFLPINLRLGPSLYMNPSENDRIGLSIEFNKLLVPTPPIYDPDDPDRIIAGQDPGRSVVSGIFGSFSDAPGQPVRDANGDIVFRNDGSGRARIQEGSRFKEELREITIGSGIEYRMFEQFTLRSGYFFEHPNKGGRQFLTFGAGVRYKFLSLDLSYLHSLQDMDPLNQTTRVSLGARF